jgi:DNA-binding MarR family transcriptional regulator
VATVAPTSLDAIDRSLRSLFRSSLASRLHERVSAAAGLDIDRPGAVLLVTLEEAPLRLSDLAARVGLDLSTVSRKASQLERRGLIERREDPRDGRASLLALTTTGSDALTRLLGARRAMLDELFDGWSDEERAALASLLSRLATDIDAYGARP